MAASEGSNFVLKVVKKTTNVWLLTDLTAAPSEKILVMRADEILSEMEK